MLFFVYVFRVPSERPPMENIPLLALPCAGAAILPMAVAVQFDISLLSDVTEPPLTVAV